jgi:hypothetical protein
MSGLIQLLRSNSDNFFKEVIPRHSSLSSKALTLASVSELYMYIITKSVGSLRSMDQIKFRLLEISQRLINNFTAAKHRIWEFSQSIIRANDVP